MDMPDPHKNGSDDNWSGFAPEVLSRILGFIDPREKGSVRLVSREFNQVSHVAHKLDDDLCALALKVANTSTGEIPYGRGKMHPDRVEIFRLIGQDPDRRARFNDLLIAAFMRQNDIPRGEMCRWLDSRPLLRGGPATVNSVQLAEQLSQMYNT